jgi:hypothetical protein
VRRVRIDPSGGIQPSHASSRRTSLRSLRQQCPSCSCAQRIHPLTRGIVRSVADPTAATESVDRRMRRIVDQYWFTDRSLSPLPPRGKDVQPAARTAADALHRQVTTGSSTSRAAWESTNAQQTIHSSRPGGRIRGPSCIPTKAFRRSLRVSRLSKAIADVSPIVTVQDGGDPALRRGSGPPPTRRIAWRGSLEIRCDSCGA